MNTEGSQASQVVPVIEALESVYSIDPDRLYLTGQSMGGILDFALNEKYPNMFAATVYAGCQPGGDVGDSQYNDVLSSADFSSQTFVYIASAKDPKAPSGQAAIMDLLDAQGVSYGLLTNLDVSDMNGVNSQVQSLLDEGNSQNFIQFSTVAGDASGQAAEHMESFEYAYEINAVYDWLMEQSLN